MSAPDKLPRNPVRDLEEAFAPLVSPMLKPYLASAAYEAIRDAAAAYVSEGGQEPALTAFLKDESTLVVPIEVICERLDIKTGKARELLSIGELQRVEQGSQKVGTTAKSLREYIERHSRPARKKSA